MEANDKADGMIDNFIFSENNRQIKEETDRILNDKSPSEPLLITGAQGTGKSCLLSGLCAAYRRRRNESPACKVNGADFMDAMVEAICRDGLKEFADEYGRYELLLIDDIDDLADRRIMLESFAGLIGRLSERCMIVMTATRQFDTKKLAGWMRTRIRELTLYPLSKELFLEMMDSRFVSAGVKLSRKQREFLYVRSNKNVRSFDGVYNKILLNCKVNGNYKLSMNDLLVYTRP